MNKINNFELLGKFMYEAICANFKSKDFLIKLKDIAITQWESNLLTDTEHCIIDAWIDGLLYELEQLQK